MNVPRSSFYRNLGAQRADTAFIKPSPAPDLVEKIQTIRVFARINAADDMAALLRCLPLGVAGEAQRKAAFERNKRCARWRPKFNRLCPTHVRGADVLNLH